MNAQSSTHEALPDDETNFKTPDDLHQLNVMWIYGINKNVSPKCLTNGNIIYAASNNVVLYNYIEKKSYFLHHKNRITNIDCDSDGKWILSAESGNNDIVNFWETEAFTRTRMILGPHGGYCLEKAVISTDGQYLLTYAYEEYTKINIWKCKCDDTTPNATAFVDLKNYKVIDVIFDPNNSKEFCLTTESSVYIGHWDENMSKYITVNKASKIMTEYKGYGNFSCLTYVTIKDQVYVCTDCGYVAVYGFLELKIKYDKEHKDFIKLVKIDKHCIQTVTQSEEYVVTANNKGMISVYNYELKILLVYNNHSVGVVSCLSFIPKDVKKDFYSSGETKSENTNVVPYYDITSNLLSYCKTDGIALLDVVNEKYQNIIDAKHDEIAAIATHPELPHICFGDRRGRIRLFNYATHSPIAEVSSLSNAKETLAITCLKYSPSGTFLACCVEFSGLWFIDLTLLTPILKKPLNDTAFTMNEIEFSQDSSKVVVCDTGYTIVLYKHDCVDNEWKYIGKYRAHTKPIVSIIFTIYHSPTLLTFGKDCMMAEYNMKNCLDVIRVFKIDQIAEPCAVINYPNDYKRRIVIMSTNDFKYKILDCETGKTLATYLSPRYLSPVNRMTLITQRDAEFVEQYLLFATDEHIGLQMLPLDGNPFKYVAQLAHSKQINNCVLSADCKRVFTSGLDDSTIIEWKVDLSLVQRRSEEGGEGLTPYLSLIKGGKTGRFYSKMKMLFYYAQILSQGSYTPNIKNINVTMDVSKLPDILRANGYFPTEYQVENITREVNYHTFSNTINNFVSFDEFVKLYINHSPAFGEKYSDIRDAFKLVSEYARCGQYFVNKDTFMTALKKFGDPFTNDDIYDICNTLLQVSTPSVLQDSVPKENYDFLPEVISIEYFFENLLGLTLHE